MTRQVAFSSAEALRASQQATANMGRKVERVEGRLRERVSGLKQVLERSIKHQMAQADRVEAWMRSQSEQEMVMLQQSKAFAENKAQATSKATQIVLLKAVKDPELKLEAFRLEVTQQMELADTQKVVREPTKELAQQEAAGQAAALRDE